MLAKYRPLSLAVALLGVSSIATAQDFSQTVFFGDSLTDTGRLAQIGQDSNLSYLFKSAQPSFTTNPDTTWAGVLASSYGHSANPNNGKDATGTNYAIGGARVAEDVTRGLLFWTLTIDSTQKQLNAYLTNTEGKADPKALYSVWAGANDLLKAAETSNQAQALSVITTAATNQANLVEQLQKAGANYILVPNIPDVGLTPDNIKNPTKSATATTASKLYNNTLYRTLEAKGIQIIPANTFALLQEAVTNKEAFGFSNVTEQACTNLNIFTGALSCSKTEWKTPDANETHAFADGIHPSGRTHRILAQYYRSIIDSPAQAGRLPQYLSQNGKASHRQLIRRMDSLDPKNSLWIDGSISNEQAGQDKLGKPNIMLGFNGFGNSQHTGVYLAQQKQDYHLSGNFSADVRQTGIGLYHRHDFGQLRLNASAGLDRLHVKTNRHIAWDGEKRSHQARTTGQRLHASLQGSYGFNHGKATYRPYLGVSSQQVNVKELVEDQATLSTALNFELPKQTSLQGEIGVHVDYALNDKAQLQAGLGYQHEFKDDPQTVYTSVSSIREYNQSFATPVAFAKQNATTAHAGVKLALNARTSLNAGVHATHQNSDTNVGGFVGAQMTF